MKIHIMHHWHNGPKDARVWKPSACSIERTEDLTRRNCCHCGKAEWGKFCGYEFFKLKSRPA